MPEPESHSQVEQLEQFTAALAGDVVLTTVTDVTGLLIFLGLATLLLT